MPSRRSHVVLPGSTRELLPGSRAAGPVNLSEIAEITVRVRPKISTADLEKLVATLAAQPVAARTYLTKAELAEGHGAQPSDLDAVERFAQEHNLLVVQRSQAERKIILSGALRDLLNAFPADVHLYHHAGGSYRGRQGDIHVPAALAGIVTGVFGLDTRPKHRSPRRRSLLAASTDNGVPASDFAKRYNFPTQASGKTLDGAGETIAIIELGGGFSNADLRTYFNEIKVPLPKVIAVSVDHIRNSPGNDADGEVMLDIEVAGCVAPKANIAVYFGPNQGSGFLDAISAAVHDAERNPSVISISWGGPEDGEDQQSIDAYHEIFLAAAAQGVTICVASGDHGTADLDGQSWDKKIHVDHPACDPLVLACGGTQINQDGIDVVWNDETPFGNVPGGGGWASGGGISSVFQLPDYQAAYFKGAAPKSIATNKPGRGVPDIAMSATNYFVRVQGFDQPSGGTSAVAPLAAALVALLNQAKQKKVGFLNPFLYANAGLVKDVTVGTNAITGTVKGYLAAQGWDACTGLGTPDGAAILAKL